MGALVVDVAEDVRVLGVCEGYDDVLLYAIAEHVECGGLAPLLALQKFRELDGVAIQFDRSVLGDGVAVDVEERIPWAQDIFGAAERVGIVDHHTVFAVFKPE